MKLLNRFFLICAAVIFSSVANAQLLGSGSSVEPPQTQQSGTLGNSAAPPGDPENATLDADPGCSPDDTSYPYCPIDGGLSLLIAAGAAIGAGRAYKNKKSAAKAI